MDEKEESEITNRLSYGVYCTLTLETRLSKLDSHSFLRMVVGLAALRTCFKTATNIQENLATLDQKLFVQQEFLFSSAQRILAHLEMTINHIFPQSSLLKRGSYEEAAVISLAFSRDPPSDQDFLRRQQAVYIAGLVETCPSIEHTLRLVGSLLAIVSGQKGRYISSAGTEVPMPASDMTLSRQWEEAMHGLAVFGLITIAKMLSREFQGQEVKVWSFSFSEEA